ncbi:hypothetical protein MUK42_33185 [Musa troglodytarum]|uniref:Uncharacterized protein n=1 Tax=Musa troglodytarum TaxID=320322 RepID=A0A9E7F090_9LILI|nr:hypothetical protein MUK42_33185 [Musa troglodytarum]
MDGSNLEGRSKCQMKAEGNRVEIHNINKCSTQQKTTISVEMETTGTSLWRSLGFAIFPETLTVIC